MKISRNNSNFGGQRGRRRNPLILPVIIFIVILALLLGWFWSRGGDKPQQRVERPIPAERLGH